MVKLGMTPRIGAGSPVDAILFEARFNCEAVQRSTALTDANPRRKKPDRGQAFGRCGAGPAIRDCTPGMSHRLGRVRFLLFIDPLGIREDRTCVQLTAILSPLDLGSIRSERTQ